MLLFLCSQAPQRRSDTADWCDGVLLLSLPRPQQHGHSEGNPQREDELFTSGWHRSALMSVCATEPLEYPPPDALTQGWNRNIRTVSVGVLGTFTLRTLGTTLLILALGRRFIFGFDFKIMSAWKGGTPSARVFVHVACCCEGICPAAAVAAAAVA